MPKATRQTKPATRAPAPPPAVEPPGAPVNPTAVEPRHPYDPKDVT